MLVSKVVTVMIALLGLVLVVRTTLTLINVSRSHRRKARNSVENAYHQLRLIRCRLEYLENNLSLDRSCQEWMCLQECIHRSYSALALAKQLSTKREISDSISSMLAEYVALAESEKIQVLNLYSSCVKQVPFLLFLSALWAVTRIARESVSKANQSSGARNILALPSMHTRFVDDLGIDSMGIVEIVLTVEDIIGVEISDSELDANASAFSTFEGLIEFMEEKIKDGRQ